MTYQPAAVVLQDMVMDGFGPNILLIQLDFPLDFIIIKSI